MTRPFTEYTRQLDLESWSDFKKKVDSFQLEWIYRGQAMASWSLASSLERSPTLLELDHDIERVLVAEYRRAIRTFDKDIKEPETTLEWLALLQHHGTPTRLLDFSMSPYIAAYFAFQEDHPNQAEPVAIWCLNRARFYSAALELLKTRFDGENWGGKAYLFSDEEFEELFSHTDLDCVMPFRLRRLDQRQLTQQSVFLVPMNPHKALAEQLAFFDYQAKPIMTKLTIPWQDRKAALRDLVKMNITHATLFLGVDGFSRALNLKYSTLATIGEIGQWFAQLKEEGFVR